MGPAVVLARHSLTRDPRHRDRHGRDARGVRVPADPGGRIICSVTTPLGPCPSWCPSSCGPQGTVRSRLDVVHGDCRVRLLPSGRDCRTGQPDDCHRVRSRRREVETRFVDLTLARPMARAHVVARTLLVFAVATSVVLGLMMAGTWAGLSCCTPSEAPRPSMALMRSLAINPRRGDGVLGWRGTGAGSRRPAASDRWCRGGSARTRRVSPRLPWPGLGARPGPSASCHRFITSSRTRLSPAGD